MVGHSDLCPELECAFAPIPRSTVLPLRQVHGSLLTNRPVEVGPVPSTLTNNGKYFINNFYYDVITFGPFLCISQHQRALELSVDIFTNLCDFLHLLQLFRVPCDQIQKGQAFKVFCPLVGHLHNLMVSLHECRFPQSCPCGFVVQNLGRFQCNLN